MSAEAGTRPSASRPVDRRRLALPAWTGGAEGVAIVVVAVLQAGTLALTWNLWAQREHPPLLPALELPGLDLHWPLLASLVLVVARPRVGVAVHLGLLAYGFALDQTRLQPEFVSMAILLAALTFPAIRMVGIAHLSAVWLWAGLHKLFSTGFLSSAAFMSSALGLGPGGTNLLFWAVPVTELSLGLLALWPRTRRIAVVLAWLVHLTILYMLSPLRANWNSAVWLWNLALPVAATALLPPRDPATAPVGPAGRARVIVLAAAAAVVLHPATFYLGLGDAYLTHNLYSGTPRRALVNSPTPRPPDPFQETWTTLNVPLPPEPRLFRAYFDRICEPGDVLAIGPRQTRFGQGRDIMRPCPTP